MKRFLTTLLLIVLIMMLGTALADPISVKGLKEGKLYELYSEVQAQLQLNQLQNKSSYIPVSNYDDIERNPSKHTDELMYFEGTVIQVVEDSYTNTYRIASGRKQNQVFIVTYTLPENAERILEDDKVCVYAQFKELYTYKSTANLQVTAPLCEAALIIPSIDNNKVASASQDELETALSTIREQINKTSKKDHDYTKLTKTNYPYYSRNAKIHEDQKITFTGKVLQTIDDDYITSIRVAVDSDSDKVVYLIYANDISTIRVLEDDTITIKGKYTGLYTYSSTLGGEITIPSCVAESVDVKGYNAPKKFAKDKEGNYKLTKQTYQDYSRRPNAHKDEPITFTAEVIQVIEGTNESQ